MKYYLGEYQVKENNYNLEIIKLEKVLPFKNSTNIKNIIDKQL